MATKKTEAQKKAEAAKKAAEKRQAKSLLAASGFKDRKKPYTPKKKGSV